jgi:proteasome lid subunit RPN8/RPN11
MNKQLVLSAAAIAAIRAHAEATYPNECVGLLVGTLDERGKQAVAAHPVENRWAGQVTLAESDDATSQRDRFYLDPRDYLAADRAARAKGLDLVGCYHSHPDWPAEPSERDRVGSQTICGGSFSFLIQRVDGGQARELRSWLLSDDGLAFSEELIESDASAD